MISSSHSHPLSQSRARCGIPLAAAWRIIAASPGLSMKTTGIPKRITRQISALLPSASGPALWVAAALSIASTSTAVFMPGAQGASLGGVLCTAAVALLAAMHWSIKGKFHKVSESLESIGLGELSGRAETILEGQSGRVIDSVHQMNRDLVGIVRQVRGSADRIRVG